MNQSIRPPRSPRSDVAIIGAGPVGLLLANLLGQRGLKVVLFERLAALVDYPRGVGMDDECLRAFQSAGVVDRILPHTTPHQWMRFVNGRGKVFASIEPKGDDYGWPRRNAFVQPMVDRELANALERYPSVTVRFGQSVAQLTEGPDGVTLETTDPGGRLERHVAQYVVACDGGKSATRKALGIAFEGKTSANRWIVVDLANDPVGRPNAYLHADPHRPFVSIALPHGIRRFEFMLFPGEGDDEVLPPEILNSMLKKVVPDPHRIDLIRARVYTHNARIARQFQKGRVLLAGDAAHVMPVWQGQGYNSGIRDAANLGWKLAGVVQGVFEPSILDTYETERRQHAAAMISISETAGRVLSVRNPLAALARDALAQVLGYMPPVKRYFLEMRYKPVPRYRDGALDYGPKGYSKQSWVGRMFIQTRVSTIDGATVRLDEVLGQGFALLAWGVDPTYWFTPAIRTTLGLLGGVVVSIVPSTQLMYERDRSRSMVLVGDVDGRLKEWFGNQPDAVVILRPDRFIAATCVPQALGECLSRLSAALKISAAKGMEGPSPPSPTPALTLARAVS